LVQWRDAAGEGVGAPHLVLAEGDGELMEAEVLELDVRERGAVPLKHLGAVLPLRKDLVVDADLGGPTRSATAATTTTCRQHRKRAERCTGPAVGGASSSM